MTKRVVLIDYGIGNLLSVRRAFEACAADVVQTNNPAEIEMADYLVLPGVGAFGDGMRELQSRQLVEPIRAACASGKPLLGICLGMQLLFTESEEFGLHKGLDLLPGRVVAIPNEVPGGAWRKTPHIGWNELRLPPGRGSWGGTLFSGMSEDSAAYFVHSYAVVPADSSVRLADCEHEGIAISAAVQQGQIYGCQFHPEKSGEVGLSIIANFLSV